MLLGRLDLPGCWQLVISKNILVADDNQVNCSIFYGNEFPDKITGKQENFFAQKLADVVNSDYVYSLLQPVLHDKDGIDLTQGYTEDTKDLDRVVAKAKETMKHLLHFSPSRFDSMPVRELTNQERSENKRLDERKDIKRIECELDSPLRRLK